MGANAISPLAGAVVEPQQTSSADSRLVHDVTAQVARRVVGRHVLWLIRLWLKAPVEERDGDGTRRMSGGRNGKRGTPQGGVASPLLANIYMNRFLNAARQSG